MIVTPWSAVPVQARCESPFRPRRGRRRTIEARWSKGGNDGAGHRIGFPVVSDPHCVSLDPLQQRPIRQATTPAYGRAPQSRAIFGRLGAVRKRVRRGRCGNTPGSGASCENYSGVVSSQPGSSRLWNGPGKRLSVRHDLPWAMNLQSAGWACRWRAANRSMPAAMTQAATISAPW